MSRRTESLKFEELFYRVKKMMGWDDHKVVLWFNTENPSLGGVRPVHMVDVGKADRLEKFIAEAEQAGTIADGT